MANSLAPSKDGGLNIFIVGHGDVMCEIEKISLSKKIKKRSTKKETITNKKNKIINRMKESKDIVFELHS